MRRVAITGMGIISPLGNTCEDFFSSLAAGKSGIRRLSAELDKRLSIKIAAEADFRVMIVLVPTPDSTCAE